MMPASVYVRAAPAPSFHESGPHSGPAFLSPIWTPWPSAPWHDAHCAEKIAAPALASILSIGTSAAAGIALRARHTGFCPTRNPRDSQVTYATRSSTSVDDGVGRSASAAPGAFSLRL